MPIGAVYGVNVLVPLFHGADEGRGTVAPGVPEVTQDGLTDVCENSDSVDTA